jgi:hypothetical protein
LSKDELFKLLISIAQSEWYFRWMSKDEKKSFISNLYNKLVWNA